MPAFVREFDGYSDSAVVGWPVDDSGNTGVSQTVMYHGRTAEHSVSRFLVSHSIFIGVPTVPTLPSESVALKNSPGIGYMKRNMR